MTWYAKEISIKLSPQGRQAAKRPKRTARKARDAGPCRALLAASHPAWERVAGGGARNSASLSEKQGSPGLLTAHFPRPGIVFGGNRCWEVKVHRGERR